MELPQTGHDPVQLVEVLEYLAPTAGKVIVDCTTGRGGHSSALAERLGPTGTLICLDADPRNMDYARQRLASAPCRVRFFHANFGELDDVLKETETPQVDGILADLGISTNQLFDEQYGLSFAQSMPLDMRLDPRLGRSAADLVNHLPERELADILFQMAQERYSFKIARKIGEARRARPITTTGELADLVRNAIPTRYGPPEKIDPATRTFMALRMAVNDELGNLKRLLDAAPRSLKPGGRFAVISFHSMEDRLVKQAFRTGEEVGALKTLTKKPLTPTDEEIERNPRSRSAKLRVAERIG
jgi:16S rRNA (cytosine1402-N4)-methyltransferase